MFTDENIENIRLMLTNEETRKLAGAEIADKLFAEVLELRQLLKEKKKRIRIYYYDHIHDECRRKDERWLRRFFGRRNHCSLHAEECNFDEVSGFLELPGKWVESVQVLG